MLSHHYARLLISQGFSEDSICKKMGHADITTTRKVYGHWMQNQEEERREAELIDRTFSYKNPIKMTGTDQGFYEE